VTKQVLIAPLNGQGRNGRESFKHHFVFGRRIVGQAFNLSLGSGWQVGNLPHTSGAKKLKTSYPVLHLQSFCLSLSRHLFRQT
jgi:hypothetical protein